MEGDDSNTSTTPLSSSAKRRMRKQRTKAFWKDCNAATQRSEPHAAEEQLPPVAIASYKRARPSGPLPEGVRMGVELEVYWKEPDGSPGFFHRGKVVDLDGDDGRVSIRFHDGDRGRFDLRQGSLEIWRWPTVETVLQETRAREKAAAEMAELQHDQRLADEHAARLASERDNDVLRERNAALRRAAAIRDGAVRVVDAHPQGGHVVIMPSGVGLCAPHELAAATVISHWSSWVEGQVGSRRGQPSSLFSEWKAKVLEMATARAHPIEPHPPGPLRHHHPRLHRRHRRLAATQSAAATGGCAVCESLALEPVALAHGTGPADFIS